MSIKKSVASPVAMKEGDKAKRKKPKEKSKKRDPAASRSAAPAAPASDVPLVDDERFSSQHWDPRFGRVPARASTASAVQDERFEGALSRPGFQSSAAPVDRFGRAKRRGHVTGPDDESSSDEEEARPIGPLADSESDSDVSDSEVEDRPADEVANAHESAIPPRKRHAEAGRNWTRLVVHARR